MIHGEHTSPRRRITARLAECQVIAAPSAVEAGVESIHEGTAITHRTVLLASEVGASDICAANSIYECIAVIAVLTIAEATCETQIWRRLPKIATRALTTTWQACMAWLNVVVIGFTVGSVTSRVCSDQTRKSTKDDC